MIKSGLLKEIKQSIGSLIQQKKFMEANQLCNEFSILHPNEPSIKELKAEVADEIRKENSKIIKVIYGEALELFEAKNYRETLLKLKPVVLKDQTDSKVVKLFQKAQEKYKESIEVGQKNFIEKKRTELESLAAKDHNIMLTELAKLESSNPDNPWVKQLAKSLRKRAITEILNENKKVIKSEKFDIADKLIKSLKSIDANNDQVKKLEIFIRKRKFESQVVEREDFVYQAQQHLDTLMKLKKYDKAIIVANELLEVDRDNKITKSILSSAEKELFKQTRSEVQKKITKDLQESQEEYKKNPEEFIKLDIIF